LVPDNLPSGTLLDNSANWFNSFRWDQKQSATVPTDLTQMTTNHFAKARTRHWLAHHAGTPDFAVSLEVAPSPDTAGTILGQITWFDYAGKSQQDPCSRGTQILPSLVARRLPDSSTWYESYQRNGWGLPTSVTTTDGTGNPAPTRTYTYAYDASGRDLTYVWRPGNELEHSDRPVHARQRPKRKSRGGGRHWRFAGSVGPIQRGELESACVLPCGRERERHGTCHLGRHGASVLPLRSVWAGYVHLRAAGWGEGLSLQLEDASRQLGPLLLRLALLRFEPPEVAKPGSVGR